jgi:hypothetical protein
VEEVAIMRKKDGGSFPEKKAFPGIFLSIDFPVQKTA